MSKATVAQVAALCARRLRDSCASRSTARKPPPPCRTSATACASRASRRRLIGDFHYIGHKLLAEYPACAEALAKYRINPGNVGFKDKRDTQFADDRRDRDQARQDGAHRRQLGLARPGAAHQADGREHGLAEAEGCARGHARGDGAVGAVVGGAGARARHAQEQDDPVGEGLRRAGSDRGLSGAGAPLRLRHPSRPHRGRHGLEGHRRLVSRARHSPAGRHRRHHPHFADAGARRRPHPGSTGRAGTAADHGLPHLRAAGGRLPRLRPHHLDHVPGAGALDPGFHPRRDAGLEDAVIRASRRSTSR